MPDFVVWRDPQYADSGSRTVVTFDLDSTLASTEHRRNLLPTGLESSELTAGAFIPYSLACDKDPVVPGPQALFHVLQEYAEVWVVSARSGHAMEKTVTWLHKYGMRPSGVILEGDEDRVSTHGWHGRYKAAAMQHVEKLTGQRPWLHVDDVPGLTPDLAEVGVPLLVVQRPEAIEAAWATHPV